MKRLFTLFATLFVFGAVVAQPTTDVQSNYQIGDIATINGVQGIVFQTSPNVKIVSMVETSLKWCTEYWRDVDYMERINTTLEAIMTTDAKDKDNGLVNMSIIKSKTNWQSKFPAFKWCSDLGEGWYLPAVNELKALYVQADIINQVLKSNKMGRLDADGCGVWSSTEFDRGLSAYFVEFEDGGFGYGVTCYDSLSVRAVFALD